ncbi:MAG: ParB N-terminal domain-containing protein [Terriglobales bacterium]
MALEEVTIKLIPVEDLTFDPQNPRLPSSLDGSDEKAVLGWMLSDATVIELMGSLGEKGYFPGEPLLVVYSPKKKKYEVIEGNRRLTAVKLLHDPELAPVKKKAVLAVAAQAKVKPVELPVVEYESRDEILDYLGFRHITGVKEWDPIAKARHLRQLEKSLKIRDQQKLFGKLARIIGSRPDYVARLLTSYSLFERLSENAFYKIRGLDEDTIDFSILTTSLNYKNISDFLGLKSASDPTLKGLKDNSLRDLTSWLFEKNTEGRTRLGESRNLKELSAVVSNKPALAAFRHGSTLAEAELLTEEPALMFRTSILQSKAKLTQARDRAHLVTSPAKEDAEVLRDIQGIAENLEASVEAKLLHRKAEKAKDGQV